MPEIPDFLEEHMRESVLGRAKLKLYTVICGRERWMPEDLEVRRFIRREFRKNPLAGRLLLTLLTETSLRYGVCSDLLQTTRIPELLNHLEVEPFDEPYLLQVDDCPEPLEKVLGVCVHRELLADGGHVYTITLYDDVRFPEAFSGYIEIR